MCRLDRGFHRCGTREPPPNPGRFTGGFSSGFSCSESLGTGWPGDILGRTDFNSDNRADLITRKANGRTALHPVAHHSSGRAHAPGAVGGTYYAYDAAGNRTLTDSTGTDYTYSYDVQGRLTSTTATPGGTTSNYYDTDRQRILRKTPDGTTTLYLAGLIEVVDPPGAGAVQVTRFYSIAGSNVAYRRNTTADSGVTYLAGNHQGSPTAALNRVGGTHYFQLYHPYGATRYGSLPSTDHAFLNQTKDASTGLNYLNNRYYDAATGVFTSVDPLVASTGEAYLYASGNPATLSDPSGLDPGCGPNAPAGLCRSSHTGDACADTSYYECGTAKAGPNVGQTKATAYGQRALDEFDRGIGIDPSRWCHINGSRPFSHDCGAPPETGEYDRLGSALAVLGYLSKFGGPIADGAGGFAEGAVVSAGANIGKNGKYIVFWRYYRLGLSDFNGWLGSADDLVVRTRWVGRSFVALQAGVAAFDSWRASEGHSKTYRFSYTAVKTVATTGGAVAGAAGGTKVGFAVGCWAGPWGCAIGGGAGAAGGGIIGAWVADEVTDVVWNFAYEELAG